MGDMKCHSKWLHDTDGAMDWLCEEMFGSWLPETIHRPELLIVLTNALNRALERPPAPSNESATFKSLADALAALLKKAYRNPKCMWPLLSYLQRRRLDSTRAGLWTTTTWPGRTYYIETSPRPLSPINDPPQADDIINWREHCEAVQALEHLADGMTEATPWTPPRTPEPVKRMREEEQKLKEEKRIQEEQRIHREQLEFLAQEELNMAERLQEVARMQESLRSLEKSEDNAGNIQELEGAQVTGMSTFERSPLETTLINNPSSQLASDQSKRSVKPRNERPQSRKTIQSRSRNQTSEGGQCRQEQRWQVKRGQDKSRPYQRPVSDVMDTALDQQPTDSDVNGSMNGDIESPPHQQGRRALRSRARETIQLKRQKPTWKDANIQSTTNTFLGPVHSSKVSKATTKRGSRLLKMSTAQDAASDNPPSLPRLNPPRQLDEPTRTAPHRSKRLQMARS